MKYSRKERCNVKSVVMDMHSTYMRIVKELFPNAKIILDKFNIVQLIKRAFNKYRVHYMNKIRYEDSKLYTKLKNHWKLLLKNYEEVDKKVYKAHRNFKYNMTDDEVIMHLIEKDKTLYNSYWMMQEIGEAIRENNYSRLENILNIVHQVSQEIYKSIRTFRKYKEYVKNTLDNSGLTNRPLEGINNKVKIIKRIAYGYRKFNNFRARILIIFILFSTDSNKSIKKNNDKYVSNNLEDSILFNNKNIKKIYAIYHCIDFYLFFINYI